ncbi:MAG: tetratricopeptide repeat protein [Opitutales bacterium]
MAAKRNRSKTRKSNRLNVFFGLGYKERKSDGKIYLRIRWGVIAGMLATLVIAGYLAVATATYFYVNHFGDSTDDLSARDDLEPLEEFKISFGEAVGLPINYLFGTSGWREFRGRYGEWQIDKGKRLMAEERFNEAFIYLQGGAIRAPYRLDGRRIVAEIQLQRTRQPDQAIETLQVGLQHLGRGEPEEDLEYVKYYVRFLLQLRRDEELAEFAEGMLNEGVEDERMVKALAWAAARAHHLKGRYDRAEDFVLDYDLERTIDGMLLSSRISWDRGSEEAAVAKLEEALDRLGSHPTIHAELTRRYVALDRIEKARRHAVERTIAEPNDVTARIELLYVFNRSGTPRDVERAEKEVREILNHPVFGSNETALVQLAQFAATSEDIGLARLLYERAIEQQDFDIGNFALQLIEAHIAAGDYHGAIEFCKQIVEDNATWFDEKRAVFDSLRSIALYGTGDQLGSDQWLQAFLDRATNTRQFLPVAQRFELLGGYRQAQDILRRAYLRNPENQGVLEALVRVELKSGVSDKIGQYLDDLIRLRRPPMDLIKEAYDKLGSDRYIFVQDRSALLNRLRDQLEQRGLLPTATTTVTSIRPL